ncbi:MAG: glycosyltransferase [Alphaproteobacteria bacterium]|nr:glycosyltransferase [Alphaproteobacteria bacterium]
MPKVSVIIPVYNTEKYLSRCLDSIVNQTYKDLEIICINDGSTDDSLKILKEYAKKDKRIKIITQKNQGLSVTRNVGLENITGQYISFIDSDDYVDLDYYECLVNLMEKNNADVVMCGMRIVDNDVVSKNTTPNMTTNNFIKKIQNLPNGSTCDKLFKADLFKNLTFPVGKYYEDNIVLLKTMFYSDVVVFTNKVSYYYFMNYSGICRTTDENIIKRRKEDRLYAAKIMMSFAKEHGFDKSKQVKDFIVRTVASDFITEESPYYREIKNILGKRYVLKHNGKNLTAKIKKFLLRILCLFIPVRTWRHKIKDFFN